MSQKGRGVGAKTPKRLKDNREVVCTETGGEWQVASALGFSSGAGAVERADATSGNVGRSGGADDARVGDDVAVAYICSEKELQIRAIGAPKVIFNQSK